VLDIICRTRVTVGQLLDNRSALHLACLDNGYRLSEELCVYAVKDVGLINTFFNLQYLYFIIHPVIS
jgi:hypothetical protein